MSDLPRIDRSKLRAPRGDIEVLVDPPCSTWRARVARTHALYVGRSSERADAVSQWRRQLRERIVGDPRRFVVVVGHQPEFIHPGVWAKYVVADRFVRAGDGVALGLVADTDAPKSTHVVVPMVASGRVSTRTVTVGRPPSGVSYEIADPDCFRGAAEFIQELATCGRGWFERSMMNLTRMDWIKLSARMTPDVVVAIRKQIDRAFDLDIRDEWVSQRFGGPFAWDILRNAREFAAAYNRALEAHRLEHGVRDPRRPMPNLTVDGARCETPFWTWSASQPRRRLFIEDRDGHVHAFAETEAIGEIDAGLGEIPGKCDVNGWSIRPRALTLTLWARLLLADLFIHGIGGAIYDEVTDRIIVDYYDIEPPPIACVSATLWMDLPRTHVDDGAVAERRRMMRDWHWNPHRHVTDRAMIEDWIRERDSLISARADRESRRRIFHRLRAIAAEIRGLAPAPMYASVSGLAELLAECESNRKAKYREYFVGFHRRDRLEALVNALPDVHSFGV